MQQDSTLPTQGTLEETEFHAASKSAPFKPLSPQILSSELGGETFASPNGESGEPEECQSNKADSIFDVDPFMSPSLTAVGESKLDRHNNITLFR